MLDIAGNEAGWWGSVGDLLKMIDEAMGRSPGGDLPPRRPGRARRRRPQRPQRPQETRTGTDQGDRGKEPQGRGSVKRDRRPGQGVGEQPRGQSGTDLSTDAVVLSTAELGALLRMRPLSLRLYLVTAAADEPPTRWRLRERYGVMTGNHPSRDRVNYALGELTAAGLVRLSGANDGRPGHPQARWVERIAKGGINA